ncbi:S-adenosyl-L-methionine-dependent methyltransferase [Syncephalastrum racemosum]|uniref:S-adenosyl-L-methionine-dependent methyltransferase n=1 Tax=Syncephalastrum racemosum TaxID=13706 RepID=A0A1X2HV36_SYNRA|nr:S-adenosyl-L-methionine-dependent methyltransferase [Syncephalastrum racemosum]
MSTSNVVDLDSEEARAVDWENCWKVGRTQWDAGEPSPALVHLLKTQPELVPSSGRALVPGCGAGYDVLLLSSPTLHVTGLDLSTTCIQKCKEKHADTQGNFDFVADDFYKFTFPQGGYDLVYDYTFLCAMHPDMRPQWSARMAEIVKPGGTLVALMFPIVEKKGGPPFAVSPELYHELLDGAFELVYQQDAEGHEDRKGKEKMSVWKRK